MIAPLTDMVRARLADATCVVSCSTGKDSVAASLWLTENEIEHERWPIDRVVEWSRTKFGGREFDAQMDLLSFGGINDGCMRWGMCETAPTDIPEVKT